MRKVNESFGHSTLSDRTTIYHTWYIRIRVLPPSHFRSPVWLHIYRLSGYYIYDYMIYMIYTRYISNIYHLFIISHGFLVWYLWLYDIYDIYDIYIKYISFIHFFAWLLCFLSSCILGFLVFGFLASMDFSGLSGCDFVHFQGLTGCEFIDFPGLSGCRLQVWQVESLFTSHVCLFANFRSDFLRVYGLPRSV